eukprot:scaffold17720_cov129-Isochrysis_galbana.AAC.4
MRRAIIPRWTRPNRRRQNNGGMQWAARTCAIWASACADVPTWFVLFSVSPVTIQNVGLARIAR